jgi:hypothetical protein
MKRTKHIFVGTLSIEKLNDTRNVQRCLHVITLTTLRAHFIQVRVPLNSLNSLITTREFYHFLLGYNIL